MERDSQAHPTSIPERQQEMDYRSKKRSCEEYKILLWGFKHRASALQAGGFDCKELMQAIHGLESQVYQYCGKKIMDSLKS